LTLPQFPDDARRLWGIDIPPDTGKRSTKHELVRQTKRVINRVALLDIAEVDDAELTELVDQARALADRLESHPTLADKGGLSLAGGDDAVLLERSGITGRSNPLAPPIEIWVDGDVTKGRAVWTDAYEGPPNTLHGGFVAAAFDDLLGCAQMASGLAGFTGTLTVRMVRPTPLNTLIEYEAGVTRVEGRKILCWGTATADGEVTAEAECLFIRPRSGLS
jgi:acyl-coenzyme A thioesterase PaaI-like protein